MAPDILIRGIADFLVIPIVLIAAWALLFKVPKGQRFRAYSRVLMAGLTAYMFAKFIGTVYQPAELRPFELLGVDPGAAYLDNPGFPSDHVLFITAIICAVWFETRMKRLTAVLIVLAVLVGIGRVLALVHTPLDVIGGVLIALLGAVWYSNEPRSVGKEHGHGKSHRRRTKHHRRPVVG
ncbi:phosphatase PAP2 family protein [Candidatus Saccharibacteria bacterium]|nr:phosphatase PAP2 family protein [Candidatus Saccharibacteria bacterium]